eukprot:Partr_v1_DN26519_c0_g1_i1_m3932 putative 6phosphofructo2kinase
MIRNDDAALIACVLVGLPARGKTFISQKLCRYLQWSGIDTKSFNVGNYRRKLLGPHTHEFFDHSNAEANAQRKEAALSALNDMLSWLKSPSADGGGPVRPKVAIYDATNSAISRRKMVYDACHSTGIQTMFIESICNDKETILRNIRDVKLKSPDYVNVDAETAAADFISRIKHYEDAYESINCSMTETFLSYIKLIDVGSEVVINQIHGYLQSRIVYYVMNLNIATRTIYISRHGESQYNLEGKIGGDSPLSERGREFARRLPGIISENLNEEERKNLVVWTSTLQRTIETSQHLPYPKLQWKALDEIDAGVCDGLTYAEIQQRYPRDFSERDTDKFHYRYTGGESYADLTRRLDAILMTLENTPSVFIIAHQAVVRCIYSYLQMIQLADLPYVHIPLHCVMAITVRAYGCDVKFIKVGVDAVDTHRDGRYKDESSGAHMKRGSYGERGALSISK